MAGNAAISSSTRNGATSGETSGETEFLGSFNLPPRQFLSKRYLPVNALRGVLGVVIGTVSKIKAGVMDVDGMLTLKNPKIVTDTANGANDDGFTGTTEVTLGGVVLKGNWGGQFYGPNKATGSAIQSEYPTSAASTFSATGGGHTPVSLLVVFGAHKH